MTKKIGRPTKYSNALADRVCMRVMDGESLLSISDDEDMPARGNLYKWLLKHDYFRDNYAHACEVRASILFDEVITIADNTTEDDIFTADGNRVANNEWINRSKLRIDSRKWVLAKMMPKRYGDKLEVDQKTEHSGEIKTDMVIKFVGVKNKK